MWDPVQFMTAHSSPLHRSHSPIHPNYPKSTISSTTSTPRLTVESLLNLLKDKVKFVQFSVNHDDFEHSSLKLLKLVFPEWFLSGNSKHLKLAQCTDGITNKRNNSFIYNHPFHSKLIFFSDEM